MSEVEVFEMEEMMAIARELAAEAEKCGDLRGVDAIWYLLDVAADAYVSGIAP